MNHPRDDRPSSPVSVSTPVVLRIMPKVGSSAPIGYIYDPNPLRDGGEGGLLAAAAAFFTHQGHEVFRDSCPDLEAYRRAGRITSTIVDVDRLPDHILSARLDLLASFPLLPWGTHSACLLWRNTFPFLHRLRSPELILSPSLPLFLGGLGGAFTPSDRRLSHFSTSLREVCVPRGGVRKSIPSLKNTPHHALAVSSHRLNMGGALAPVAVSLLCPSLRGVWGAT
jgi:hypothetical protein